MKFKIVITIVLLLMMSSVSFGQLKGLDPVTFTGPDTLLSSRITMVGETNLWAIIRMDTLSADSVTYNDSLYSVVLQFRNVDQFGFALNTRNVQEDWRTLIDSMILDSTMTIELAHDSTDFIFNEIEFRYLMAGNGVDSNKVNVNVSILKEKK